jgi:glutamyl-tRNA synthetase
MIRTRFAPSPTGFMHVGGARTALFAWLVARQAKGQFWLRIEDTDRNRHVEESEQHIMDSLRWLGLEWDEGPLRQSERLETYRQWAEKLIDRGRAYADTRSPEELETIRKSAAAAKKPPLFREHRPKNASKWQPGMPLRFSSEPKAYTWHDEVLGELSSGPEVVDDFILIKSDGFPTYNFAHIVDDYDMKISHVIRSQEFLSSVPKFLNLYEALSIERPKLATLPFVLGPEGKRKLSKRDGAKDVLDYKKLGFLPEALINFLATLGWNDGTEQEIFSVDELTAKFSLERVHRGGARFDEQRLEWMNGHYIREKPLDALYELSRSYWPPSAKKSSDEYKRDVLALVAERLKYLAELSQLTGFFFEEPKMSALIELYNDPKTQKLTSLLPKDNAPLINVVVKELSQSDFSLDDIKARLNQLLDKLNTSPRVLFTVIRIAITGVPYSPELFGTLSVLGKEKSLNRLKQTVAELDAKA